MTQEENNQINAVEKAVQDLKAKNTAGLNHVPENSQSPAEVIYRQLEAVAERAVLEQVKPLQALIEQAEELIKLQYTHLARYKMEVQALLRHGARASAMSHIVKQELEDIRSAHAEVIGAKTSA